MLLLLRRKQRFAGKTTPSCLRTAFSGTVEIFPSLGPNRLFTMSFSGVTCFHTEQITRHEERALTVLGELDELSSSSGESSSSSGSVGMAGGSDGRERVWGKMKGLSAAQGASQDSLAWGSLGSRGDPWSKSSSSSCSCKTEHISHLGISKLYLNLIHKKHRLYMPFTESDEFCLWKLTAHDTVYSKAVDQFLSLWSIVCMNGSLVCQHIFTPAHHTLMFYLVPFPF